MIRYLSLLVAVAAIGALVATPAYAPPGGGGGGGSGGTPASKAAFAYGGLNLIATVSTSGKLEDPDAQGPTEKMGEGPGGGGKHNGDDNCTYVELVNGGCVKNEDGAAINPILDSGTGMPVPTIIDGNGICDTDATGKNFFGDDESSTAGACKDIADGDSNIKFSTILRKFIKAPKHKDLWINVSLECGNFTHTSVSSKGGELDASAASAMVRVRVKVTDDDGNVYMAVPDENASRGDITLGNFYGADDGEGVVFCRRHQALMAHFQGIIDFPGGTSSGNFQAECIIEDPNNAGNFIVDPTCLRPEQLTLVIDQLQANSFNFLMPNLPDSSVYQVDVEAWLDTEAGAQAGEATAAATIGLGSMIIQVLRLVKGDDGTSETAPIEVQ